MLRFNELRPLGHRSALIDRAPGFGDAPVTPLAYIGMSLMDSRSRCESNPDRAWRGLSLGGGCFSRKSVLNLAGKWGQENLFACHFGNQVSGLSYSFVKPWHRVGVRVRVRVRSENVASRLCHWTAGTYDRNHNGWMPVQSGCVARRSTATLKPANRRACQTAQVGRSIC